MPPFVKERGPVPLSAATTLVAVERKPTASPFSQAIDEFLTELKEGTEAKNPFVKEIRVVQQRQADSQDQNSYEVAATDLKSFIQDLEEKKRGQRSHRVLQRLTPFIDNLAKLMALCAELVQAAPFGVSIVFAGARIVLSLAVQTSNCFDSIVDGIEEIGISLKCYDKFADAFRSSPDIQELLISSYKRIIRFWFNVSRILSASRFKGVVKSLVAPINKEVNAALDGLKRDGERVSISAQATTAQQRERDREAAIRAGIIRWITSDSPVDVRINLRHQVELHQDGTCQWLLDDSRFQKWCKSNENVVLWYHAKPGSGKTVLAAAVIEHLRMQGQNFAYFFYSFNSPGRKKGISGLRSLALQLLRLATFVPQTLLDRFETEMSHSVGGLYDQSTAVATVHDLLKHGCANVCIVVDGLDECADEEMTLTSFENLLGLEPYGVVKWFFTSRDQPHIRAIMERCKAVEIEATTHHISQDIRAYLSNYITCQGCVTKWSEGEDNFLYARLICETLRGEGLTSEEEIDQALMTYPKDLNGYYMRVLEKLSERSELEQERARRTFLFLVAAGQSVSLNELLDFLAITRGAKDYDRRRVPFIGTIRDLCSPFVVFDKPVQGDDPDNPLLKLCHKTVEEFFQQSPDSIDLKSGKLERYFVNSEQADESIGLDCITYLQYDRYQHSNIVSNLDSILRKPIPREHAFLAYAATFWTQHLERVPPTPELYNAIHDFLCSPAFWTCLAVQTRVGRYLFGRYIGCKSSSQYRMGIRGSRTRGDDCFGLPLPRWLDRYSHEGLLLDRSMCHFIDEWREVLLTCTEGLLSCLPLILCEPSCHLDPPEKPRHCRVAHLSQHLPEARVVGRCHLLGVAFTGKTPWADLLYQVRDHPGQFQHLRVPLFMPKKEVNAKKKAILKRLDSLPLCEDSKSWTVTTTKLGGEADSLEAWMIVAENLSFRRVIQRFSECHRVPSEISARVTGRRKGKWNTMSIHEIEGATGPLLSVHMSWIYHRAFLGQGSLRPVETAADEDSDDDTNTSSEEDDDDISSSDDDVSETSSTGPPESTEKSSSATSTADPASDTDDSLATDCLVVVPLGGKPYWLPWSVGQRIWSRVQVTTHPTLPIVAVTHTARQLEVIDLKQGTKTTKHLLESPDEEVPLASVRELRFSACASYLHLLRLSFYPRKASTEVHITLSTFRFHADSDDEDAVLRHSEVSGYKYMFGETLADVALPLALTCWSDNEVVIALPPLTCDPKIIKIGLRRHAGQVEDIAHDASFCTLRAPIYFPTSTPRRKARLLYRSSEGTKGSGYICLALDGTEPSEHGAGEDVLTSPPVVLRWKIAELGGWREWEEKQDGTASDLKRGISDWQMLKGDFVDNDKYFRVPIRSGLDWTRKGHLSCAAF